MQEDTRNPIQQNSVVVRSLTRRQFLHGVAVAAGGLALAACAAPVAVPGAESSDAGGAAPSAEQTVISLYSGGDETEIAMFDAIVAGFEAENPDIRVDKQYDPTMSWPKTINMLRTGTAADIQRVNDDSVFMLTAAGVVTVLDDFFDRDLNRDDYYPIMFEERTGPGNTLGSAYVCSAPLIGFFNLDLMDEAGLEMPTDWIEGNPDMAGMDAMFERLIKRTGDRVDVYPFHAPYWQIVTAIYNVGVDMWAEDGTRSTMNDSRALEVVELWQSWFEKGYFVPEGEDPEQLFNSGLLAIKYDYAPFAQQIPESIRFDIGPTWGGTRVKTFQAGRNISIPSFSEHKEEAWQFLKYMLSKPGQEEIAKIDWGVPVLKEVAEGPVFLDPNKRLNNHQILPSSLEIGSVPWPHNPASEAYMIPFRQLTAVNTGQQAPDAFISEAEAYLTGVLESVGWDQSMDTPDYRMSEETFAELVPEEE